MAISITLKQPKCQKVQVGQQKYLLTKTVKKYSIILYYYEKNTTADFRRNNYYFYCCNNPISLGGFFCDKKKIGAKYGV